MEKKIMEGNAKIAEFMGITVLPMGYISRNLEHGEKQIDDLKYHSSWNELMEVVEKIERGNFGIKQCRKVVEIYYDDNKEVIYRFKEKSRIESLWTAIVAFVGPVLNVTESQSPIKHK